MTLTTSNTIGRGVLRATFGALVAAGYSFIVQGNLAFDIITGALIAVIIPAIADALYGAVTGSRRVLEFEDPKQQAQLAKERAEAAAKEAADKANKGK